jgi:hypothetical protein
MSFSRTLLLMVLIGGMAASAQERTGTIVGRVVFGFYQGGERFPIQREYYSPTYSFGLRWVSHTESK